MKCFYEKLIQCKKHSKIHVYTVDLSHNTLSPLGMGTVIKLLEQWESKELIITGNCLQYDGLVTLVHAIVNENYSIILQRMDAQLNNALFTREQISQLCELVVFNNNCNIRYANIESFIIIDGNDLDDNSDITDVCSVCFTGNINAKQKHLWC